MQAARSRQCRVPVPLYPMGLRATPFPEPGAASRPQGKELEGKGREKSHGIFPSFPCVLTGYGRGSQARPQAAAGSLLSARRAAGSREFRRDSPVLPAPARSRRRQEKSRRGAERWECSPRYSSSQHGSRTARASFCREGRGLFLTFLPVIPCKRPSAFPAFIPAPKWGSSPRKKSPLFQREELQGEKFGGGGPESRNPWKYRE